MKRRFMRLWVAGMFLFAGLPLLLLGLSGLYDYYLTAEPYWLYPLPILILGALFTTLATPIILRVLRQRRTEAQGILAQGTIQKIEPSEDQTLWSIHYTYQDHFGQTHNGMFSAEVRQWRIGDTGPVRFNPMRVEESIWVRPEKTKEKSWEDISTEQGVHLESPARAPLEIPNQQREEAETQPATPVAEIPASRVRIPTPKLRGAPFLIGLLILLGVSLLTTSGVLYLFFARPIMEREGIQGIGELFNMLVELHGVGTVAGVATLSLVFGTIMIALPLAITVSLIGIFIFAFYALARWALRD